MGRYRSVVSRIVALHFLAIIATSICMPLALFLMLRAAVEQLHHQALRDQAADIVRYLSIGPDGTLRLSLPPGLAEFYSAGYGRAAYAVIDTDGRVCCSSSSLPGNRAITDTQPGGWANRIFSTRSEIGAIAPIPPGRGTPIQYFFDKIVTASRS